ncbi:MAG: DUF1801 domain-containing protein [Micropepsaceae bacterium]
MVSSSATSVKDYLDELPGERRKAIAAVRRVIRKNLPKGYVESMQYGMISYIIPLKRFPETYNKQPLANISLASQKNHMPVYLMGIYGDKKLRRWFEREYKKTNKRMDVGKCCVRFKKLEDLPLEIVGKAVAAMSLEEFIAMYENARASSKRRKRS